MNKKEKILAVVEELGGKETASPSEVARVIKEKWGDDVKTNYISLIKNGGSGAGTKKKAVSTEDKFIEDLSVLKGIIDRRGRKIVTRMLDTMGG